MPGPAELDAARSLAARLAADLQGAPAFHGLDSGTRAGLQQNLAAIQQALGTPDPYALTLDSDTTPWQDHLRTARVGSQADSGQPPAADAGSSAASGGDAAAAGAPTVKKPQATETLAARTGALIDEVGFPAFVAALVHGTFDAIVDATIRQMEAYADLVAAVAKDVDQFTNDNITLNQVRDELAQKYPADLYVDVSGSAPALRVRAADTDEDPSSRSWLADYGLAGQDLTEELAEEQLIPAARRSMGESRQQLLAVMVLLGMSRITVRDGRVSAKVRFRAAATDAVALDYATSQDPSGGSASWGARGSAARENFSTMVSTVGVNAQSDINLNADLFGQVEINFVSETLPLERFADPARQALVHRSARWSGPTAQAPGGGDAIPTSAAPAAPPALPPVAPAPPLAAPPPVTAPAPVPASAPVAAPAPAVALAPGATP